MIFTYFLLLSELPFTFLMLSCEAQKLLFVMRPNVSTFFFVACFSCVISKNSMLNARSWRFPLMFSLRIDSFSSYIIFLLHFVLFMFMMKGLISFFCMQLFSCPAPIVEKAQFPFLHWIAFTPLSKIIWAYLCGSISGSPVLFYSSIPLFQLPPLDRKPYYQVEWFISLCSFSRLF